MSEKVKKIASILIGLTIAFVIVEVFLRIYNPFPTRIKGNKIELASNFKRQLVVSPKVEGLDDEITYSTNSLGLRGYEPPKNFEESLTIIAVGGSTTECSMLDDEKTWAQRLNHQLKEKKSQTWINNAGLDGCSTIGHLILMDDYLLKLQPDIMLFLIGINDIGAISAEYDLEMMNINNESLFMKVAGKSEAVNLVNTLYRNNIAKRYNMAHQIATLPDSTVGTFSGFPEEKRAEILEWNQSSLPDYEARVQLVIDKCKENDITPVLITQPLLDGYSTFGWKLMSMFNNKTIEVANKNDVLVIDLANKLDKKVEYYYDNTHYTNKGAEKVANIIYQGLLPFLNENY